MFHSWHQLMAGFLISQLPLPDWQAVVWWGKAACWWVSMSGPRGWPAPGHLALRKYSICGPRPSSWTIPGWQQPEEQKVCLSAPAAPPPRLSLGPLSGAPLAARAWCSPLPWHRPEMKLWRVGGREGSQGMVKPATRQPQRPGARSGAKGSWSLRAGLWQGWPRT